MEKYFVMVTDAEQLIGDYQITGIYDRYSGDGRYEGYIVYEIETGNLNSFYKISEDERYRAISYTEDRHIDCWEKIN